MGASPSREVRRILWLDTEGGIRGVPCWDIAIVNETTHALSMHRICCAKGVSKRIASRLRESLPCAIDDTQTCVLEYTCTDGKWAVESTTKTDKPVGDVLLGYLGQYKGSLLSAWGMKTHDEHVLRSILPKGFLSQFTLTDCLAVFRRNLRLPKNSLSQCGPGTPRGVFNVHGQEGLGSVHTAHVDALNMRQLCHRAFHILVEHGEMEPRKSETYSYDREKTLQSVLCLLDCRAVRDVTDEPIVDIKKWGWLMGAHFWEPRVLKANCASDVKNRVKRQLRRALDVEELPCHLSEQMDSANTDVEIAQCIVVAEQYLTHG